MVRVPALCILVLLATAAPAVGETGVRERLEDCQALSADRAEAVALAPAQPFHGGALLVAGSLAVVLPADEGCHVYDLRGEHVSRAVPVGSPSRKLRAVRTVDCWEETCPVLLVLDQGAAVAPLGADCDVSVTLRPVRVFAREGVAELVCRDSAGAGSIESWYWVGVQDAAPVVLLTAPTGHSEAPTDDERRAPGFRPIEPTGCLVPRAARGVTRAAAVIPRDAEGGPRIDAFRWDPESRRFVADPDLAGDVRCPRGRPRGGGTR